MIHQHTCHLCGVVYDCLEKRCKAQQAAKVNKRGPYCSLCRHGQMFIRYAQNRGIDPKLFISVITKHERELSKT